MVKSITILTDTLAVPDAVKSCCANTDSLHGFDGKTIIIISYSVIPPYSIMSYWSMNTEYVPQQQRRIHGHEHLPRRKWTVLSKQSHK